jgi:hypothetical protein
MKNIFFWDLALCIIVIIIIIIIGGAVLSP